MRQAVEMSTTAPQDAAGLRLQPSVSTTAREAADSGILALTGHGYVQQCTVA